MLMATDKVLQRQITQQLIGKGEAQGFILYEDILALIPNAEQNLELVEEVMDSLAQAGVTVSTEPPHADPLTIESADPDLPDMLDMPGDDDLEGMAELEAIGLDLIEDLGYQQAIETDDVVGLYLKEAGRVPLLTGEEEVRLAKRMEMGRFALEKLQDEGDYLPLEERMDLNDVVEDGNRAQEHLIQANSRLVISVAKKVHRTRRPLLRLDPRGQHRLDPRRPEV